MKPNNLVGERFSRLVVVADGGRCPRKNVLWKCVCDCGNETLAFAYDLRAGKVKSCGCYAREPGRNATHGHAGKGKNRNPIYSVWASMVQRCTNPKDRNWKHYGARGITVCDAWRSFPAFYSDMGDPPTDNHTLERIDNGRGYDVGNCKWATRIEQARNKRSTVLVTVNGKTQALCDWADELGISRQGLYYWTKKGLSYGDAIERILSKKSSQEGT